MASKIRKKRAWMVMGLEHERPVSVAGRVVRLPMTWADGMVGVIPVFRTKQAAMEYSGGVWDVMQVEYDENIPQKGRVVK